MAEARINDSCIIGLPTCGYAFNSSRMTFVATPADEEFALELDVINTLLKEKQYECYIAPWIQLVSATVNDVVVPKNTSWGV